MSIIGAYYLGSRLPSTVFRAMASWTLADSLPERPTTFLSRRLAASQCRCHEDPQSIGQVAPCSGPSIDLTRPLAAIVAAYTSCCRSHWASAATGMDATSEYLNEAELALPGHRPAVAEF